MKKTINALKSFIDEQRDYYPTLMASESWDDHVWITTSSWLPYRGKSAPFRFNVIQRLKGFENQPINDLLYIDFMKAILVYFYRIKKINSFQQANAIHLSSKRLYAALVEVKRQTSPVYIDIEVAKSVESSIIQSGYTNVSDAMTYLALTTRTISGLGLTLTSINFQNKHKNNHSFVKKALAKRRLKDGEVDDTFREEDKLMSWRALKAFTIISNNPKNEWVRLGCRIMDLCIITGMRGDEILYLPVDCWRETETYDDNTGEVLFDNTGMPIVTYGVRYDAEKGAENRIHWLSEIDAPVAKRAIDEIKKITEPYRLQASFIKENNGKKLIQWSKDRILLSEIINFIVTPGSYYRDRSDIKSLRDHTAKWLNNLGVKNIGRTRVENPLSGNFINDPVFKVVDIEKAVQKYFEHPANPTKVTFTKDKRVVQYELDELLVVAPPSALTFRKGARVHVAPKIIDINEFNYFIGASEKYKSVFDEYGMTEEDGSRIELTSHMSRHNRNTFLALAGMSEHEQAIAMGRRDIKQNESYQHLTLKELHHIQDKVVENNSKINHANNTTQALDTLEVKLKKSIGNHLSEKRTVQQALFAYDSHLDKQQYLSEALDAGTLLGELQDTYNEIKTNKSLKDAKEFIKTHGSHLHIVPNGACTRDLALHKCPSFLKCIDVEGCSHLHITGRVGEAEQIEFNYKNSLANLAELERKFSSNSLYDEFVERQRSKVKNLKKVHAASKQHAIIKPVQVFPKGRFFNITEQTKTVVDCFSESQEKVKEEEI